MSFREFWVANHSLIVGAVVVAVTSYGRFNVPPTSRSSTTWARYHALASLYTLAFLVSWLLISSPDILAVLTRQFGVQGLEGLELPLYAAVLLTIVAHAPPLNTVDAKVRGFLQELARIPWEAQRLSAALRARTWLPDERFQSEIRQHLARAGFDEADVSFSSERTPAALWTRITALQWYIDTWQTRRGKFAGFYFANLPAISELRAEFARLEENAKRVFSILRASRRAGVEATAGAVERELAEGFVGALEQLQKALCDLVSRGVLTCGLTRGSRRAEFETIGFMVNVTPSRLFDNLLGLYLALALMYVVVLRLAGRPNAGPIGVSIATTYLVAIVMAMLVRRTTWAPSFPIASCALAAVAAFSFASISSFALGILTTGGAVPGAWGALLSRLWPWGLMSAGSAALVAWSLDRDERPGLRQQQTIITAVSCMALAVPVVWLLRDACGGACNPPPYWRVMLTASIVGGLIGFFVPTWYRQPEVMASEYAGWKLIVGVRRVADDFVAVIDALPPRSSGGPKSTPIHLPLTIEERSTDDAIAEAIRKARLWIDALATESSDRPISGVIRERGPVAAVESGAIATG